MRLILDTSFLIELKRGNPATRKILEERMEECEDIVISAITAYELLVGAYYTFKRYGDARDIIAIDDMLSALTISPVDFGIAKRAAGIKAELKLKGSSIPDIDIIIASTDSDKSGEILTFDEDFIRLKDLGFNINLLSKDKVEEDRDNYVNNNISDLRQGRQG
ncbi:MAG: type II toxin-antitoxin system VapC family toxin [Candidatus Nitrosocaldus sp.]